jgi:hypothetical protein
MVWRGKCHLTPLLYHSIAVLLLQVSVDLSRPLVASEGNLDPFDGLVTYRLLQEAGGCGRGLGRGQGRGGVGGGRWAVRQAGRRAGEHKQVGTHRGCVLHRAAGDEEVLGREIADMERMVVNKFRRRAAGPGGNATPLECNTGHIMLNTWRRQAQAGVPFTALQLLPLLHTETTMRACCAHACRYDSQDPLDLGEALWLAHWGLPGEDWAQLVSKVGGRPGPVSNCALCISSCRVLAAAQSPASPHQLD